MFNYENGTNLNDQSSIDYAGLSQKSRDISKGPKSSSKNANVLSSLTSIEQ